MEEEQYYGLEVECWKKAPGIILFSRRGHMKVSCALDFWEVFWISETSSFTQSEKSYLLTVARLSAIHSTVSFKLVSIRGIFKFLGIFWNKEGLS